MANLAARIRASVVAEHPGAVVIGRGERSITHRLGVDGLTGREIRRLTTTSALLHHDGQEVDTTLRGSSDALYDDEADALPYRVRVKDGNRRVWPRRDVPGEFIDLGRPEFQQTNGQYAVIPWDSRERVDNQVIFRRSNAELRISVGPERLKMDLVLLAAPARNTWRFPISLTGLTRQGSEVVSDTDGSTVMHVAPFTLEDASGLTADIPGTLTAHPTYQGAYRISPDLSGLVYPVVIDPTLSLPIAASGNDGAAYKTGSTYPPTGTTTASATGTTDGATCQLSVGTYTLRVGLLKWDTSSLDDGATIDSALLRVHITNIGDVDARNLTGEAYNWGASVDSADYTDTSASDMFSVDITTLTNDVLNDIPLSSVAGISLTGTTYMRLHISGGEPSSRNQVLFAHEDNTTLPAPELEITYTLPSVKKIISETLGLLSATARAGLSHRVLTDTLGIGETLARMRLMTRIVTDTLGIASAIERFARGFAIVSEVVGLHEARVHYPRSMQRVSETLGLLSATARTGLSMRAISETLGIGEAVERYAVLTRIVNATLGLIGTYRQLPKPVKIVTDTLGIVTGLARTTALIGRQLIVRFIALSHRIRRRSGHGGER